MILSSNIVIAQYTYHGRVFNERRQKPVILGKVRPGGAYGSMRTGRNDSTAAQIDSLGYFSITLKNYANVTLVADCGLDGKGIRIVSYADTLIVIKIKTDCFEYNVERAENDIKGNKIYLLCSLGYVTYKFSDDDSVFEKKYGLEYRSGGDEPIMSDCMWLYNKTVAEYLDKKFGLRWRKEVRWDAQID